MDLYAPTVTADAPAADGAINYIVAHPHGKHVITVDHDAARVAIYWHTPLDGSKPYLVVDIDSESDDPALAIYINDTPLYGIKSGA